VQVVPSNGPTMQQEEYDAFARQSRRIVHVEAAE
jgi:formate dehydrogenase major subunit